MRVAQTIFEELTADTYGARAIFALTGFALGFGLCAILGVLIAIGEQRADERRQLADPMAAAHGDVPAAPGQPS